MFICGGTSNTMFLLPLAICLAPHNCHPYHMVSFASNPPAIHSFTRSFHICSISNTDCSARDLSYPKAKRTDNFLPLAEMTFPISRVKPRPSRKVTSTDDRVIANQISRNRYKSRMNRYRKRGKNRYILHCAQNDMPRKSRQTNDMKKLKQKTPTCESLGGSNAGERTRTSTGVTPPEPKSDASANFATPAWSGWHMIHGSFVFRIQS